MSNQARAYDEICVLRNSTAYTSNLSAPGPALAAALWLQVLNSLGDSRCTDSPRQTVFKPFGSLLDPFWIRFGPLLDPFSHGRSWKTGSAPFLRNLCTGDWSIR